MSLETGDYITDLVITNPAGGDLKSTLDDHARLTKKVLKQSFPSISGAVTMTHTQLNTIPTLAPIASPTFTGVPAAPTATVGTSTTQLATTAFVAATSFSTNLPGQTGNAGKALGTDGSSASWVSRGLVLLATLTPTAAANVDFLSTFTSDYADYLILYNSIKPGTTDDLRIRVAIAGAASSANTYYSANSNTTGTTAATSESLGNGTSVLNSGCGANGSIVIRNTLSTGADKSMTREGEYQDSTGYVSTAASAVFTTAGALTGFRLFWAGGNNFAASGTVRVYGFSKV